MPSLPCSSITTSLSDPRCSWASPQWPATKQRLPASTCRSRDGCRYFGPAVGTSVACDSVDHILACLWAPACHSPREGAGARGHQPCLRHRERLLSSGRKSLVVLLSVFVPGDAQGVGVSTLTCAHILPCSTTYRSARLPTHRHKGPHLCEVCALTLPLAVSPPHVCRHQETGLSPLARSCSWTWSFLKRLHVWAYRVICM